MPYRPAIDEKLCFVLMPFGPPFDGYYKRIIKPIVGSAGLQALRADEIYRTKAIVQDIWNGILRARLIVADVTKRNANVNYELGLCHAVGAPTIIITQRMDDVPFDYKHRRCIVYNTREAGWESRLGDALRKTIATTLREDSADRELRWPYEMIEAGRNLRATQYKYADVMDHPCEYVLLTGTNFGDQFGTRSEPTSRLYDQIIKLLKSNVTTRIRLLFAPPDLLKKVIPHGYKDLVEKSLPRIWDLATDPSLSTDQRNRLQINCHIGAMFMSVFVRDPDHAQRALIITTPRWVSDTQGLGRMFFAVWRKENPDLFNTLWVPIFTSVRLDEGHSLAEVVENLGTELGQGYIDFIHKRVLNWRLTDDTRLR
jgi:hypothetical protein